MPGGILYNLSLIRECLSVPIPTGADPNLKKDDYNFDITSIMTELRSRNERLNSVATKSDLEQNL